VIVGTSLAGTALPPWASHLEHKLAPPPLLLVQAFVNTADLELGTDILARADDAHAWLASAGLAGAGLDGADPASTGGAGRGLAGSGLASSEPGDPEADAGLRLAREVRESIRAMIARNSGGEPLTEDELRPLRQVALDAPPRLEPAASGEIRLEVASSDHRIAAGLTGLLVTIRDAQADRSWDRLKVCGNADCQWAFYDRSHSLRGAWCDMASCGNRLKNRNLRARRAQDG
jgi:predicted RNA-binding Zn ribbon-like protein